MNGDKKIRYKSETGTIYEYNSKWTRITNEGRKELEVAVFISEENASVSVEMLNEKMITQDMFFRSNDNFTKNGYVFYIDAKNEGGIKKKVIRKSGRLTMLNDF